MTKGRRTLLFGVFATFQLFFFYVLIKMPDVAAIPITAKVTAVQAQWMEDHIDRLSIIVLCIQFCFTASFAAGFIAHYKKRWSSRRGRIIDIVIPVVGLVVGGIVLYFIRQQVEIYAWQELLLTEVEGLVVLALLLSEKPLAEETAEQIE